ncbi:hypothetical protein [Streptomyces sp. NPDC001816]|uniref:hypothetical protein n=1 Tax=Streptomyces sp. NPDC001816 TaxID=3364612 RepID=UPI003674CB45
MLTVALPLYVPDTTEVLVRLADSTSHRTFDRAAALTPANGARSLLEVRVPVPLLRNARWRAALVPPRDGGQERVLGLPLLLKVGRRPGAVEVTPTAPPGLPQRLLRAARRVLGAVLKKTTGRV